MNVTNAQGETPLHVLVQSGDKADARQECATLLLDAGATVAAVDSKGWTALHGCAEHDALQQVTSLLIERGADPNAVAASTQQSPLHRACAKNQVQQMLVLISKGASAEAVDAEGKVPFTLLEVQPPRVPVQPSQDGVKELLSNIKQLQQLPDSFQDISLHPEAGDTTAENGGAGMDLEEKSAAKAHRAILAARCPLLRAKLADAQTLDVPCSAAALSYFLEWVYTGGVESLQLLLQSARQTGARPDVKAALCFELLHVSKWARASSLQQLSEQLLLLLQETEAELTDDQYKLMMEVAKNELTAPFTEFCASNVVRHFGQVCQRNLQAVFGRNDLIKVLKEVHIGPPEREPEPAVSAGHPPHAAPVGGVDNTGELYATGFGQSQVPWPDESSLTAETYQAPFDSKMQKYATFVIKALLRDKHADPFRLPVNAELLGIPQYPDIIKRPMDLGTIETKLRQMAYESLAEFIVDFRLICSNACVFNAPDHYVNQFAVALSKSFEKKMTPEKVRTGLLAKQGTPAAPRKNKSPAPTKRDTAPYYAPPPPQQSQMSFQEKRELGENLNLLQPDQLFEALEIIKKDLNLATDNETIDLDMNALSQPTLFRLRDFIDASLGRSQSKRFKGE